MKIAVTGHSAGIGQCFTERFVAMGHEIQGLSRRHGHNIRNIPKAADLIQPCDVWINNAQSGYAQTELLIEISRRWNNQPDKMIWIISTVMARDEIMPDIPAMDAWRLISYRNQKRALEDAVIQLRTLRGSPKMVLVRPGSVATSADKTADVDSASTEKWVATIVDLFEAARQNNLWPIEVSLGFDLSGPRL